MPDGLFVFWSLPSLGIAVPLPDALVIKTITKISRIMSPAIIAVLIRRRLVKCRLRAKNDSSLAESSSKGEVFKLRLREEIVLFIANYSLKVASIEIM